jgi:TetR/AcrR family fatty acid metabolism transcriptional regulator
MNERSFMARPALTPVAKRIAEPRPGVVDKREAILKAATRVFAQSGFFNAQVADVAKAAGVAAGTVYLYFRSKDDLLVSLFERTMKDAIAAGRDALAGATDPRERLGRDRDLAVVFQVELRQSTKFMERFSSSYLREYLGIIREAVEAGQTAGLFRSDVSATVAAKILFGALDEMATNWMLSRRRYSLEADADAVIDLFLHGVHRHPPVPGGAA